jgi:hypothetical protein
VRRATTPPSAPSEERLRARNVSGSSFHNGPAVRVGKKNTHRLRSEKALRRDRFFQIRDVGAGLFDNAHELMAHDHVFELRKETIVDVQVRTADGGGGHPQNDILWMLNARIIHVIDFNVTGVGE